jgi:hypothetical protein
MSDDDLLSRFLDRARLAAQLRLSTKTIAWCDAEPNGLLWLKVGARKLDRVDAVRRGLESRQTRPNRRAA